MDATPPRLSVEALLSDPQALAGREIELVGVLTSGTEDLSIGAERTTWPRIWVSLREGAPEVGVKLGPRSARVVVARGVFHPGPAGHLDRYAGELRPVVSLHAHRPRREARAARLAAKGASD